MRVEAPKARALLAERKALTVERRAYLEQVLAWADALRAERPNVEGWEATPWLLQVAPWASRASQSGV